MARVSKARERGDVQSDKPDKGRRQVHGGEVVHPSTSIHQVPAAGRHSAAVISSHLSWQSCPTESTSNCAKDGFRYELFTKPIYPPHESRPVYVFVLSFFLAQYHQPPGFFNIFSLAA